MTPISKVPKALLKAKDTPKFLDSVFVDLSRINEGKQSYFILEESSELVDGQVEFVQNVSITRGPFGSIDGDK